MKIKEYEERLKYAWSLYYKGIGAGTESDKRYYLTQAKKILNLVPDGYSSDKDELLKRINPQL